MLKEHLAAAAMADGGEGGKKERGRKIRREERGTRGRDESAQSEEEHENHEIFQEIVNLGVGEALLFAPTGMLDVGGGGDKTGHHKWIRTEKGKGHDTTEEDVAGSDEEENEDRKGKTKEKHEDPPPSPLTPIKLGATYLKIRIRDRLTSDGGRSRCVVDLADVDDDDEVK